MAGDAVPSPVREYRFLANLRGEDLAAFREGLVDLAGGFTEVAGDRRTRWIVGLRGKGAKQRILRFLTQWARRSRDRRIDLEDRTTTAERDEIYFLLPLQRNPDPAGGPRLPLFTNEQLIGFREELARRFHFRPEAVRVYGSGGTTQGS